MSDEQVQPSTTTSSLTYDLCPFDGEPTGSTPFCVEVHQKVWLESPERDAIDWEKPETYDACVIKFVDRVCKEKENGKEVAEL